MSHNVRVGVGCFVYKNGRFLMQQRTGSHGQGTWSVPGGHLEYGETPEQCASREVMEETGVSIQNIRFLTVTNDIFTDLNKHYITIWVTSDWLSGEPYITEPDKCLALDWRDFDSLPTPLFEPCWSNFRFAMPELFQ